MVNTTLRLKELHESCKDTLFIVMRVYFEKPRTTTGWKGLINDPHIDGTFDIETGLRKALRRFDVGTRGRALIGPILGRHACVAIC